MLILGFRIARYNKTKITKPVTTKVYKSINADMTSHMANNFPNQMS